MVVQSCELGPVLEHWKGIEVRSLQMVISGVERASSTRGTVTDGWMSKAAEGAL